MAGTLRRSSVWGSQNRNSLQWKHCSFDTLNTIARAGTFCGGMECAVTPPPAPTAAQARRTCSSASCTHAFRVFTSRLVASTTTLLPACNAAFAAFRHRALVLSVSCTSRGSGYAGDTSSARYTHLVHTLMVWQVVPTHAALATTWAPMHQQQLTCLRLGCNGATRQQRRRAWRGERGWVEPRGLELAVQRLRVTRKDEHDARQQQPRQTAIPCTYRLTAIKLSFRGPERKLEVQCKLQITA